MKKVILFCWLLMAANLAVIYAQNTWTQKASFGGLARSHAAAFSLGNKGYIGLGISGNITYYLDFWEYDPATNVWTQKADFPGPGRYEPVSFSIEDKGYVGVGASGSAYPFTWYRDFWEYNPSTNTWTQKADFGGAGRRSAAGFSVSGKGYIGTGVTKTPGDNFYSDFWEYNPSTNSWTQKANFGGGGRSCPKGFSIGDKGYLGTGYYGGHQKDFWEYNPATDTWTRKADFGGTKRESAVGFSIGNKGFLGTGYTGSAHVKDFWEYDPATDRWTQRADCGSAGRAHAVGFSIGDKGYIGTGITSTFVNDFWEYTPLCVGLTVYADADGDSYGDNSNSYFSGDCSVPAGYVTNYSDCNDANAEVNPAAAEVCNSIDDDCDGLTDDTDPSITGQSTWYVDADADNYGNVAVSVLACNQPSGYVADNTDCNDADAAMHPGAKEVSNGLDDNCNGIADDLPGYFWTQKNDIGGVARAVAIAFSIGGKGYVGTGMDGGATMKDFWEFDPLTNAWTQMADVGGQPRAYAIGISMNGKGYVGIGLQSGGTYAEDFWEYDPIANAWTEKAPFPGGPRSGAVAFSIGSKAYVGTGESGGIGGGRTRDMWEYDQSSSTWTSKNDFGGDAIKAATTFSIGSKGYLVSGNTDLGYAKETWEYDQTSDTWTRRADFDGEARNVAAAFCIGNKGYYGTGEHDGIDFSDFWEYDPITDRWTQKADYGGGEIGWTVGFAIGDKGYIGTGYTWGVGYRSILWEFVPSISVVSITGHMVNQSWEDSTFWRTAGLISSEDPDGIPDSNDIINVAASASGNLIVATDADMKSLVIDSNSTAVVSFGTSTITLHDGELSAPKTGALIASEATLVVKGEANLNVADSIGTLIVAKKQAETSKITLTKDLNVKKDLILTAPIVQIDGAKKIAVERDMISASEVKGTGVISFTGSTSSTVAAPETKSQGKLEVNKSAEKEVKPTAPMKAESIQVSSGKLLLENQQIIAPISIKGGELIGKGTIVGKTEAKPFAAQSQGKQPGIRPGFSPGLITINGDLELDSAELGFELLGTVPDSEYDQIEVIGAVLIADNVTLDLSADSIPDFEFIIIDNDGSDAIEGRFEGLTDNGDTLTISGYLFRIYYDGGDGNDVALKMNNPFPEIHQCPSNIVVCQDSNIVEYSVQSNTIPAPVFTYSFSGATDVEEGTTGTGSGSAFNVGITNVIVTATNTFGSTSCSFTVEVTNSHWYADADMDGIGDAALLMVNCTQPAGYVADNTDCNDADAMVNPGATEICNGIDDNCDGEFDETTLNLSCSSSNGYLYFGFSGDQTSTISATVAGGTPPYTVSITMDRLLKCNEINSTGDEVWTGLFGSTSGNVCPDNSSPGNTIPVTSASGVGDGTYSVSVTLMDTATITATVTDAYGCTQTCTTLIYGEDVRCFAGKSGIEKVTICHRTGSVKNPCVKMCIDESAVQSHLDHGDKLGTCPINCIWKDGESSGVGIPEFGLYPNPTSGSFTLDLSVNSDNEEKASIFVIDLLGQIVIAEKAVIMDGTLTREILMPPSASAGWYLVRVVLSDQSLEKRLLYQK